MTTETSASPISYPSDAEYHPQRFGNEVEQIRKPPYSLESEQSVLGAILLDNEVLDNIAEILQPDDFFAGAHRIVFSTMLVLSKDGIPIDPIILKQQLEKNEELQAVGGLEYLMRLMTTVPTAANAAAYAKVVQDRAVMRSLARVATTIVEEIYRNPTEVDATLDAAEQRVFDVAERKNLRRSAFIPLQTTLKAVYERIEQMSGNHVEYTGLSTGLIDLDRTLTGLHPSDLLILAARPAMGKTALAMNIAANVAFKHTPVGVFSLEMSREQLAARLLASQARVNAQSLRIGRINADEYQKLGLATQQLYEIPMFIDDTPALSVMTLRARARRLKREHGLELLIIDYLQLMKASGTPENRVQEITQISQGLKAIAKELNIPVIALSQLSRLPETRPDKRPILSDLRESGSIEQDADVVMFVFREEYYNRDDPALKGKAELIIAKHRNGPTGTVMLSFRNEYTRFDNYAPNLHY